MDDAFCMDLAQRFHQGQEQPIGFFYTQSSAFFRKILVQRRPIYILHDEVCSVIFFKIAVDPDDMFVPIEGRKRPGFLQELFLSVFVVFLLIFRECLDRLIRRPVCELSRQILFDGNTFPGLVILGDVGDTKAALAKHTADCITAIQDRSRFERQRIFSLCIASVIAAEGADSARWLLFETVIACIGHSLPLLSGILFFVLFFCL